MQEMTMATHPNIQAEIPLPGLEQFYQQFFENRLHDLSQLKASLVAHDLNAIRDTAHRWKGFCAPYGFEHLGDIAAELETQAITGDELACAKHIEAAALYLEAKHAQDDLQDV
jgi:HPt (histidine-containing phosphotransfer) domain-containing protein